MEVRAPARRRSSLSLAQARRIALGAQGFATRRPSGGIDRRHLRRVFGHVGVVQMDSVNVLVRSHYLPLFSRLGAYPRRLLEDAAYGPRRELFEYWGHEASLLPLSTHPLLRWRMERARGGEGTWGRVAAVARDHPELVHRLRQTIADNGPAPASAFENSRNLGPWWGWSQTKTVLEYLFWCGDITTAYRRNFERVYDLSERVLPRAILDAPALGAADAQRELIRIAARACGIASEKDLRDYFRLDTGEARARIAELVERGELETVDVEGWKAPAYLAPGAQLPRTIEARALLSPFDSLVWERSRTRRLFGFDFRLEIYVPAHQRVHGYYVLPFLYGDRLVARVDLKSDRAAGTLLVQSAHFEGAPLPDAVRALREEVRQLAAWLELERVEDKALRSRRAAARV